jgi:hypothetical protein
MLPTIDEPKRPTSDAEIDALEARLKIKFPMDYRLWLLKYNGGRPTPNRFQQKGKSGPYTDSLVAWFLAIHDGKYSNLESKFKNLKVFQKRLPENLVAIADDPFGNEICITVAGKDYGAVYFWDHEEEGPEGVEPDYRNCHLVADSFTEFINNLH